MAEKHEIEVNEILLNQSGNMRLFKSHAGRVWQGKAVRKGNFVIIKNPISFLSYAEGFPDIYGWTETIITPDMIGKKIAVFTAVEVKTGKQKLKKMQKIFKELIERMGGIWRTIYPH